MKKIQLQIVLIVFVFALNGGTLFAQSKAATPAKNSPIRRAIFAVVKKEFPAAKIEIVFLVQGNWARVVYDADDEGASSVNVILKKTGKTWKIVFDYNAGSEEGDEVDDYIKDVPEKIKNPWSD